MIFFSTVFCCWDGFWLGHRGGTTSSTGSLGEVERRCPFKRHKTTTARPKVLPLRPNKVEQGHATKVLRGKEVDKEVSIIIWYIDSMNYNINIYILYTYIFLQLNAFELLFKTWGEILEDGICPLHLRIQPLRCTKPHLTMGWKVEAQGWDNFQIQLCTDTVTFCIYLLRYLEHFFQTSRRE